jgi:hypothetical protein
MKHSRFLRFSLRGLLVLTTLIAVGCYWFARPSLIAHDFANAVTVLDVTTANEFIDRNHKSLFDFDNRGIAINVRVKLQPISLFQLLCGRRKLWVHVTYYDVRRDNHYVCEVCANASPFGLEATGNAREYFVAFQSLARNRTL